MIIQKIKPEEKELINQIDDMYIDFLKTEEKYDSNYNMLDRYGSFAKDIEKEDRFVFASLEDGKILGYIYGYIEKNILMKEASGHIGYLYVNKEVRKKGIASKLIDTTIDYLKENNISIVELKCFNNNEVAQKLYEKYSFSPLWTNYRKNI